MPSQTVEWVSHPGLPKDIVAKGQPVKPAQMKPSLADSGHSLPGAGNYPPQSYLKDLNRFRDMLDCLSKCLQNTDRPAEFPDE